MRARLLLTAVAGIALIGCAVDGGAIVGDAMVRVADVVRDAGQMLSDASTRARAKTDGGDSAGTGATGSKDAGSGGVTRSDSGSSRLDAGDAAPASPTRTRLTGACTTSYASMLWAEFDVGDLDVTTRTISGYKCNYVGDKPAAYTQAGDCTNAWEPIVIRGSKLLVRCGYSAADKWETVTVVIL